MDNPKSAEWDTCQIAFKTRFYWGSGEHAGLELGLLCFVAEARGPHGAYAAGKSPETPLPREAASLPVQGDPVHVSLHQQLVDQLVSDGWQPISPPGADWWQRRFTRRSLARPRSIWQELRDALQVPRP